MKSYHAIACGCAFTRANSLAKGMVSHPYGRQRHQPNRQQHDRHAHAQGLNQDLVIDFAITLNAISPLVGLAPFSVDKSANKQYVLFAN